MKYRMNSGQLRNSEELALNTSLRSLTMADNGKIWEAVVGEHEGGNPVVGEGGSGYAGGPGGGPVMGKDDDKTKRFENVARVI
jgi:hypothetical protein